MLYMHYACELSEICNNLKSDFMRESCPFIVSLNVK